MASTQQQDELPVAVIVKRFKEYLLDNQRDQLLFVLTQPDDTKHYGIYISIQDLISEDVELGNVVLNQSLQATSLMDISIREAEKELLEYFQNDPDKKIVSYKELCHCRFYDLPPVPEFHKSSVGMIRSDDLGRLVQFSGTVIRTGVIKMLESEKEYECQNQRCRCHFKVKADIEQGGIMEVPTKCPNNSSSYKCKSTQFKPVEGSVVCCDYEEILVQERIQMLDVGTMPRSITVILLHDLVDCCKAGDDIVITGLVRQRWKPLARDMQCEVRMIVLGLSIRLVSDKDNDRFLTEELIKKYESYWNAYYQMARPFSGRNLIIESICPELYGMYLVKLSLLLILIGGVSSTSDEQNPVRGQSHLLIVGDSSTGKSQLLLFAGKIAIRSVMTTGLGTTSAGLTCSAVKDSGEWMLEGGALVLGDRGVCCIDEFDAIREHDRATIHEAMEQQRLSVAKAGIVTTLNTRTVVIATCNCRGKYDVSQDISVNTSIASPLLSRFDLILLLLDQANDRWDKHAVNHVLSSYKRNDYSRYSSRFHLPLWTIEELKGYILHIQRTYQPKLSQNAQLIFSTYYRYVRSHNSSGTQVTVRLLESLIRLGQAHARLMMRNSVLTMDAVQIVVLMECSVFKTGLINTEDILYIGFPKENCHESEYLSLEAAVLSALQLENEIEPTSFDSFKEYTVNSKNDNTKEMVISSIDDESSGHSVSQGTSSSSPSRLFPNQSLYSPVKEVIDNITIIGNDKSCNEDSLNRSFLLSQVSNSQAVSTPMKKQMEEVSLGKDVVSQVRPSQSVPHPSQSTPSQSIPHPSQSNLPHPSQSIPHPSQSIPHPSQSVPHPSQSNPPPPTEDSLLDEEELLQLLDIDDFIQPLQQPPLQQPPPQQPLQQPPQQQPPPKSDPTRQEIDSLFSSMDVSQVNSNSIIHSQKEIENSLPTTTCQFSMLEEPSVIESSQFQASILNSKYTVKSQKENPKESFISLDDLEDLLSDDMKGILLTVCFHYKQSKSISYCLENCFPVPQEHYC